MIADCPYIMPPVKPGWLIKGELYFGICILAKSSMAARVIELGRLAELT